MATMANMRVTAFIYGKGFHDFISCGTFCCTNRFTKLHTIHSISLIMLLAPTRGNS